MTTHPEGRPNPDALLAALDREDRGKLKIFLGAAPGVGKTFAMLSNARRLKLAHLDVVVGLVETHGRAETQALIDGLEILPRRIVPYRGRDLAEFDLDAALLRKPALMIVDELAHSNTPDSRHPKRYQDVAELLEAGIDVWTAMNIQHLESLSDVVTRLTGVTVRETVPDTVVDLADDVVVVDITPAELITRLSEGCIYLPETAARAANSFFKPGNLTALRELALRRTADRVDDQMVDHLRHNAIEGAWPTAERILVCVGADAASEPVVRAAGRLASGLNAPWTAVTLERSGHEVTDEAALRRVDAALRLAERLGAETTRLSGTDLPTEILRFARRENITQIVVGRSGAGSWARLRGRSLSDALLRCAANVAIHVVVNDDPAAVDLAKPRRDRRQLGLGMAAACGSVAAAVGAGLALNHLLRLPNLSMVFLAAVLACAVRFGQWAAIAAAVLSFFAYNFFFIAPVYSFTVAEPHEVFALLFFLLVAVVTGGLAGRVRDQSAAASNRVATIQALYDVSRKLAGTAGLDDVLWVVVRQAAAAVRGQAVILLGRDAAGHAAPLAISAAFPPEDDLQPGEWAAARWAFERGEAAGWRTDTLPNALYRFHPIRTSRGLVGVVGLAPKDRAQPLPANDERTLAALIDQGALAIERALLVTEARAGEALAERERLQNVLLSSLSHDLRTPLASILGAVTSLQSLGDRMPAEDRSDLLGAIKDNAVRLTRFVANLLDMTRVESGGVALRREPIDLEELFATVSTRARRAFPGRSLRIEAEPDLPLVTGDPVLFEQVLFNILDNADKYAEPGSATLIRAVGDTRTVVITVEDRGPGIPAADLDRVFEKFMRLQAGDGRSPGTGLGLAIAKGVVEAMGGSIRAESPIEGGRGARFIIRLPAAAPAAMVPAETEDAV